MIEEVSAGGREFFKTIAAAALLYFICGLIMSVFTSVFVIGAIISVFIFCIFGFFVMTRYASRYTYTLKDGYLRVNRMIGKRNKEVEIPCSKIEGVYYGCRPQTFPKRPYHMRKSILPNKKLLYIEFKTEQGRGGLIIEPSEKLRAALADFG